MNSENIKDMIGQWLAKNRPSFDSSISPDVDLFEMGIIDSMDYMLLLAFLEKELSTSLDIAEFDDSNIGTMNGLAREIFRRVEMNGRS